MSDEQVVSTKQTRCVIVGAGPGGMFLALLLARRGVPVVLLESHHDFDRDFRGDTVHPSTLEILDQLGLAEKVHQLPHGKVRELNLVTKSTTVTIAKLARLKTKFPYVMMLPQAKFLDFLAAEARNYPDFELIMGANVQRLVREGEIVRGVVYRDGENRWHEVRADLTVAADGRFSKIRSLAEIEPVKTSPPMDIVWFRLPKREGDPSEAAGGYIGGGHLAVVLDRGDEWQIAYVILKGSFATVRKEGLPALHAGLAAAAPWLADRAAALSDWKQVAVLNVESSRVKTWHKPGLLLIGDAAHVMSPVGGVGINYAVQDAVEAANTLAMPLKNGTLKRRDLVQVQRQREWPVRVIQFVQKLIQNNIIRTGLDARREFRVPLPLRIITRIPGVRNIPGRMLAFGVRKVRVEG